LKFLNFSYTTLFSLKITVWKILSDKKTRKKQFDEKYSYWIFSNGKSVMVLGSFTCMKLIEIGNLKYLFYHFGKTR